MTVVAAISMVVPNGCWLLMVVNSGQWCQWGSVVVVVTHFLNGDAWWLMVVDGG